MSADPYRTPAAPDRPPVKQQKARELALPLLCAGLLLFGVHWLFHGGDDRPYEPAGKNGAAYGERGAVAPRLDRRLDGVQSGRDIGASSTEGASSTAGAAFHPRARDERSEATRADRPEYTRPELHDPTPLRVSSPHASPAWQQPGPGYDTSILRPSAPPHGGGGFGKGGRR